MLLKVYVPHQSSIDWTYLQIGILLNSVSGERGFIFDTFIYNTNLIYITNNTGLQH